jgi:uncharacterized protein (DUF488 family)
MARLPSRIFTIGVYGSSQESFFASLQRAGIDLFVDIRARRGVRGSQYAYVNATRLKTHLDGLGIQYVHAKELAPSPETRRAQHLADATEGVRKTERAGLSESFKVAYDRQCLAGFDSAAFCATYLANATAPVLFCVEGQPAACHRSLVAARLCRDLGLAVEHLLP